MKNTVQIDLPNRRQFLTNCAALPISLSMSGCGTSVTDNAGGAKVNPYAINRSINSMNQGSRVKTLVLHYTAAALPRALWLLTDPSTKVSAHYLVPDMPNSDGQFDVYALVPESMMAYHAGFSSWAGERQLNAGSIGIEMVNLGYPDADDGLPLMSRRWYPLPGDQIAVLGALAGGVVQRHAILPHRVVGHSDVAPGRKFDPGPLFPWQQLYARYGVGAWPNADAVNYYAMNQAYRGDILRLQAGLLTYGYDVPQTGVLDEMSVSVISAFQMHFRPARYDGVPDIETAAILDALLEKYHQQGRSGQRSVTTSLPAVDL